MNRAKISGSQDNPRNRHNFAKIPSVIAIPNLIEIQCQSFESFLQLDVDPLERKTDPMARQF